jgi:hypothetical protein
MARFGEWRIAAPETAGTNGHAFFFGAWLRMKRPLQMLAAFEGPYWLANGLERRRQRSRATGCKKSTPQKWRKTEPDHAAPEFELRNEPLQFDRCVYDACSCIAACSK